MITVSSLRYANPRWTRFSGLRYIPMRRSYVGAATVVSDGHVAAVQSARVRTVAVAGLNYGSTNRPSPLDAEGTVGKAYWVQPPGRRTLAHKVGTRLPEQRRTRSNRHAHGRGSFCAVVPGVAVWIPDRWCLSLTRLRTLRIVLLVLPILVLLKLLDVGVKVPVARVVVAN